MDNEEDVPRRQTTTTLISSTTTTHDNNAALSGDIHDIANISTSGGGAPANIISSVGNISATHGNISGIGNLHFGVSNTRTSSAPKWLVNLFNEASLPQKKLEAATAYAEEAEIGCVEDLACGEGDVLVGFIKRLDFKLPSVEKLERMVGVSVKEKLRTE